MKFNREKFFSEFRKWRSIVTPQQFKGLTFLLDCIETDKFITRIDWAAYMLGTTMHETAYTFLPIHEYGSHKYFVNRYGSQTRIGRELGNDTPEEGADYAGQGDVQLTGETNYEKAEIALRREYPALIAKWERETGKQFDLTVGDQPNDKDDPKNAQNPQIAYAIMSYGMRSGMFTGKRLNQYFHDKTQNWVGARAIINGTDRAQTIAGYGLKFYQILSASLVNESEQEFKNTSDSAVILPEKDALPAPTPKTPPNAPESAESNTLPSEPTQKAEQITNINNSQGDAPKDFVPEEKTLEAPPPSNMLSRGWKWVVGFGLIPTTGAGIIEAAKNAFADGTLNMRDVLEVAKQMLIFMMPYLFYIGIGFVVFWGIKELLKQISFIVTQWTMAKANMHNVTVKPSVAPEAYSWRDAILPKLPEAKSAVAQDEKETPIG